MDGYGLSAQQSQRFGIRHIQSVINANVNGHTFVVNGCKVGGTDHIIGAHKLFHHDISGAVAAVLCRVFLNSIHSKTTRICRDEIWNAKPALSGIACNLRFLFMQIVCKAGSRAGGPSVSSPSFLTPKHVISGSHIFRSSRLAAPLMHENWE